MELCFWEIPQIEEKKEITPKETKKKSVHIQCGRFVNSLYVCTFWYVWLRIVGVRPMKHSSILTYKFHRHSIHTYTYFLFLFWYGKYETFNNYLDEYRHTKLPTDYAF